MRKKGAIELSMSTLVIVIISMVVLGLGVKLLYSFVSGTEQIKGQLDEQTQTELQRLLVDQGKQVALSFVVSARNLQLLRKQTP